MFLFSCLVRYANHDDWWMTAANPVVNPVVNMDTLKQRNLEQDSKNRHESPYRRPAIRQSFKSSYPSDMNKVFVMRP